MRLENFVVLVAAVAEAPAGIQVQRAARAPLVRNVGGNRTQAAEDAVGVVVAVTMDKIARVTVATTERWARTNGLTAQPGPLTETCEVTFGGAGKFRGNIWRSRSASPE